MIGLHSSGRAQILRLAAILLPSGPSTSRPAGRREPIVGTIIQMPVGHVRRPGITDDPPEPRRKSAPTSQLPRFSVTRKIGTDRTLLVVRVAGEIDLRTAPVLAEMFELARGDARSRPDITRIVADLRLVTFLGAVGLNVLDRASQACELCGVGFSVAAGHPAVTRPLTVTHLDRFLQLSAHLR
jgi:anti-sigma B factor antagonist